MADFFLIGARASGKTSLGASVASELDMEFIDLDHYLCEKRGQSVQELVSQHGWEYFRRLESEILAEVCEARDENSHRIIATGGGVTLSAANRACLRANGLVCWLRADAPILAQRLEKNLNAAQRPSLTGEDPALEVAKVLAEREPLYASCAHATLDAGQPFKKARQELLALVIANLAQNSDEKVQA